MSYNKWRSEFLHDFGRQYPDQPMHTALLLLRAATGSQRYNEITCPIDVGERELARLEKADERRTVRVRKLVASMGAKLDENGDPRGCPFTIIGPTGLHLSVPGNGLPARCFR